MKIPPAVTIDRDFWARRRVLLTGHTGFKGAWLSLWLQSLGAQLSGLAPGPPTSPSLYELAAVGPHMRERALDVRDVRALAEAVSEARPEVVFHLAAPLLVGVGAAFDFHAGLVAQAPRWMQRAGLEWSYRLAREPRRLWRRYARYNPLFIAGFSRQYVRHARERRR